MDKNDIKNSFCLYNYTFYFGYYFINFLNVLLVYIFNLYSNNL